MAINRRIGLGFTLGVDTAGGSTFVVLAAIVDGIKESDAKADTADISILTDTYKPKAKGQVDTGEVTYTIAYDPDEATSTTLSTLLGSVSQVPPTWQITFPSGTLGAGSITTKSFAAHLTGMGREIMKDKLITCSITLTKSGSPGF